MRVLSRRLTHFSLCALCVLVPSLACAQTTNLGRGAKPSFESLLQRSAAASADWCADPGDDSEKTDEAIFETAAAGVVDALNEQSEGRGARAEDGSAVVRGALAKFNDAS